ncbi:hypothetical protein IT882_06425 [Microbacterium schleiferi]|uniref:Uncharacterized protein n=1 Tax=Microbacterium schleiferi TaxID=69362 RepID=A0A7S8MZK3_9MICO|nr:hypothetical protein [Microbacterium schleiferi]QPE05628.1 hypothetical protein IT882_06425 [Microbacterium schleiferi]
MRALGPAPTPTPTGFASEAEALAAAEATYRAYVDALNQVDLGDPSTFEEVYRWTTGDANAAIRTSLSSMAAEGWTVVGDSTVALVEPAPLGNAENAAVVLAVCVDVSGVDVVDASGVSQVQADRNDKESLSVSLEYSTTSPTGALIGSFDGREGEPECT